MPSNSACSDQEGWTRRSPEVFSIPDLQGFSDLRAQEQGSSFLPTGRFTVGKNGVSVKAGSAAASSCTCWDSLLSLL